MDHTNSQIVSVRVDEGACSWGEADAEERKVLQASYESLVPGELAKAFPHARIEHRVNHRSDAFPWVEVRVPADEYGIPFASCATESRVKDLVREILYRAWQKALESYEPRNHTSV